MGKIVDVRRLIVATKRTPTDDEYESLAFAWKVCKHVKSNAIVFTRKDRTVGIGEGQMSRLDSVRIAVMKAQSTLRGSVLASATFQLIGEAEKYTGEVNFSDEETRGDKE